jgi:hypothetical protein
MQGAGHSESEVETNMAALKLETDMAISGEVVC